MHTTSPAPAPAATSLLGALYTVAEVADYLRVSEMTVYRLIAAGDLGATKIGRGWRIRANDLADYVEGCSVRRAS